MGAFILILVYFLNCDVFLESQKSETIVIFTCNDGRKNSIKV